MQKIKKYDFRLLIYIILFLFIILIFLASFKEYLWINIWQTLQVDLMWPSFADLRSIQSLANIENTNLNPYIENPYDPWQRTFNYPKIWIYLSNLLHLNREINFIIFSNLTIVSYFAVLAYLVHKSKSLICQLCVIALLFSSSSLLLIERGNNDIIVLLTVFILTLLKNPYLKKFLFFLSGMLKIYPIVIFFIFNKKISEIFFAIILSILIIVINLPEIKLLIHSTPTSYASSYGILSMVESTFYLFDNYFEINLSLKKYSLFLYYACFYIIFSAVILIYVVKNKIKLNIKYEKEDLNTNLFIMGSLIYIGTFLFFSNWDYRLVFLIFTLSFVYNNFVNKIFWIYFILVLLTMNQRSLMIIFGSLEEVGYAINIISKNLLYIILIFINSKLFIKIGIFKKLKYLKKII